MFESTPSSCVRRSGGCGSNRSGCPRSGAPGIDPLIRGWGWCSLAAAVHLKEEIGKILQYYAHRLRDEHQRQVWKRGSDRYDHQAPIVYRYQSHLIDVRNHLIEVSRRRERFRLQRISGEAAVGTQPCGLELMANVCRE